MPVVQEMQDRHLDSVIRWVKNAAAGRLPALREATFANLKRLGVKRDRSKAVSGIPKGSDQSDIQSIIVWMGKIRPDKDDAGEFKDAKAIAQLVVIDASLVARMAG